MLGDFIKVTSNLKEISGLLVTGFQLYTKCIDSLILGDDSLKSEYHETLSVITRTFNSFRFYSKSMLPRLASITKQIHIAEIIINKDGVLNQQEKNSIAIVIDQISQHLQAIQKYEDERVKNTIICANLHKLHTKIIDELKKVKEDNFFQNYSIAVSSVLGIMSSSITYIISRAAPSAIIALALASLATYLIVENTKNVKSLKSDELLNMKTDVKSLISFFKDIMQHSEEICMHKNTLECDMQNLQSCLLDELQRETNKELCRFTMETINEAVDSCKIFIKAHEEFSQQFCSH